MLCSDSRMAVQIFNQVKYKPARPMVMDLDWSFLDQHSSKIWACSIPRAWNEEADLLAKEGVNRKGLVQGLI